MIFSPDVIGDMITAHNNQTFFKLDDVYIGLLAFKLGVKPIHDRWFHVYTNKEKCLCEPRDIVKHGAHEYQCHVCTIVRIDKNDIGLIPLILFY